MKEGEKRNLKTFIVKEGSIVWEKTARIGLTFADTSKTLSGGTIEVVDENH